jgi:hypothetical protein
MPFQACLMFARKARSLTQTGYALALLTNIGLGWKRLPKTNMLAYFAQSNVGKKKGFIKLALIGNFQPCPMDKVIVNTRALYYNTASLTSKY